MPDIETEKVEPWFLYLSIVLNVIERMADTSLFGFNL
ncbi:hypothetical protein SPLC1_S531820 [Arthrospira platensis C1]|nr:hypothetical protein SPLC1_S531820 [Arthrospira platensis C1]